MSDDDVAIYLMMMCVCVCENRDNEKSALTCGVQTPDLRPEKNERCLT